MYFVLTCFDVLRYMGSYLGPGINPTEIDLWMFIYLVFAKCMLVLGSSNSSTLDKRVGGEGRDR